MGKYIRNDFSNGNSSLEGLSNVSSNINSLQENMSEYALRVLVKLEGGAAKAIASSLKNHYDDLSIFNEKISNVIKLKSDNDTVIASFGELSSVDTEEIDNLKRSLDELKQKIYSYQGKIAIINNKIRGISVSDTKDEIVILKHWMDIRAKYKKLLDNAEKMYYEMKEIYNLLYDTLVNVRQADSVSVTVTV